MNVTVTNGITINEIPLNFIEGKVLINSKQVAVVGGDINIITSKITGSGQ